MPQASSIKRNLINKANTTVVAVTAGACFVVVFCLVASTTLFGQLTYQNRIIGAKKTALKQLKDDLKASETLSQSYSAFTNTSQNIIGGVPNGTGPQDGDNAKIILDALPSKYDFPALATSLEKILTSQNVEIKSITGTDQALDAANLQSSSAPTPQVMPFTVSINGDYATMHAIMQSFEKSIRPIQVTTLDLSGDQKQLTMIVTAQTYYQPEKNLNITTKVVK